jgi:hypothetical protein
MIFIPTDISMKTSSRLLDAEDLNKIYLNSAGLDSKETESPVKIVVTRLFHLNNFHQLG